MKLEEIVLKPRISEKSLNQTAGDFYTFSVQRWATKNDIKRAIEKQFKVDVLNVKTVNMKGKVRLFGPKRIARRTSPWKKAIVKIKKGQKIDIFPQEATKEEPKIKTR